MSSDDDDTRLVSRVSTALAVAAELEAALADTNIYRTSFCSALEAPEIQSERVPSEMRRFWIVWFSQCQI